MVFRKFSNLLIIIIVCAGCRGGASTRPAATSTPLLFTPAIPVTLTVPASETPLPPPQPTVAPVEGTTSTQVNVRAAPSTVGEVLEILPANTTVSIVGKDPGENWWQILHPQGPEGKGWVTAQYVMTADPAAIPVIGGGSGADPESGNVAVVSQQLNVRSGPGTGFNSLGTLNPGDVASLTGKDANSTWLQIEFASGPDGKGWVNAGFVQAQGVENLPIVSEGGEVVGTGTPTGIPPTPTSTMVPAPLDHDSAENPIVRVTFALTGTRTLIYNGDVSSPDGDEEDWIQFVPFTRQVRLEVACLGSDVHIELSQNNQFLEEIGCETQSMIVLEPNQPVLMHISSVPDGSLRYSSYILKVNSVP